jgi:polyisoprenoid-binding protein YceI
MSWQTDTAHTEITFSVRHMMVANVRGRFKNFKINVDANEEQPALSSVHVEIEANSIDTREAKRDDHLRSPDFLNTEEYPQIVFDSTQIEMLDEKHAKIHGDLTLRDTTRPVVLDVAYGGQYQSPWGAIVAGFSAKTKINRKDWGLTWNVALEAGGWLVGDDITIQIEAELTKQPEKETAEMVA